MAMFEFPHTNCYEGDLGFIIKKLIELTEKYNTFFNYNSIKFADPIQWDITTQYPAFMVVFDNNLQGSYISKQPVPAGIDISNTDYWSFIGPLIVDSEARTEIEAILRFITNIYETSSTATAVRQTGDHLIMQGQLYKVTQPINIGEAYGLGYNVEYTTIENMIHDLTPVDAALSSSSTNPVQNKVINAKFVSVQAAITAVEDLVSAIDSEISTIDTVANAARSEASAAMQALTQEIADRSSEDDLINARIDNIIQLNPGSTTGDAELQDIRTGADGVTYPTAGDAVRGQYTNLNDKINTGADGYLINYEDMISGNVNSAGEISSSTVSIVSKNIIPLDALFSVSATGLQTCYIYCYDISGAYLGNSAINLIDYTADKRKQILAVYPTTAYIRVRVGTSSRPMPDPASWAAVSGKIMVRTDIIKHYSEFTYANIAQYGNANHVFTSSFTIKAPFNGCYDNLIYSIKAIYTKSSPSIESPYVTFWTGTGTNKTSNYELGANGKLITRSHRVVRPEGYIDDYKIEFTIPTGCTVTILDFRCSIDNTIRTNSLIKVNGHRRLPMTPYDTAPAVIMAAKAGKRSFIEIPKRLSDGTWIFYHDDELTYNDTYIRQADGSELSSSYNNTPWSSISYATASSWDWGISKGDQFKGTKPMTAEEFFIICNKTGIQPVLSVHPLPSAAELAELKDLADRYSVLDRLELKGPSFTTISALYAVFGDEVDSYVLDVPSSNTDAATMAGYISDMQSLGATCKLGIELFESTAFDAYVNQSGFYPFSMIKAAGMIASLARVNGYYSPTHPSVDSNNTFGSDYEYWIDKGVSEFTDAYNYSDGLEW